MAAIIAHMNTSSAAAITCGIDAMNPETFPATSPSFQGKITNLATPGLCYYSLKVTQSFILQVQFL